MYSSATASSTPGHASQPTSPSLSSSGPSITPASLSYFCIYNPDFGPTDETQHEQLLCYIARKTVSIDAKMRNIGLAQGLVNFARIFSPTAPCDNVHSQKNRLVFFEAEPGYWMHLSIELGTIKRTIKGADGKYKVVTEYQEHEVHDTVVSSLLKQAYGMYRVAHGTMDSLVNAHEGNTRPLQRSLEEFFESWVLGWNFEKTMTLERALDGINYLPLTKPSYQAVDRLVKNVRDKYPFMTHSMVTFEDQLVSTDIRDSDQRAVWKQIVQLTGYDGASANAAEDRKEEEEARKKKSTFRFGKSWSNTSIFGFYRSSSTTTPPSTPPLRPTSRVGSPAPSIRSIDIGNNSGSLSATMSGLGSGSSPRASGEEAGGGKSQVNALWFGQFITSEDVDEHYGVIFKHKSGLNLSFFAPVHEQEVQNLLEEPGQFNREFEDFLAELASETTSLVVMDGSEGLRSQLESVSRQIVKDAATARGLGGMLANDKEIRFLYFNKMNLAIKAQLSSTTGKGGITMGSEMALSLLDIKSDFDRMPDATEITTRSPSNHWIVGKRFEDREVYMIVSRKDSTLVEVEDEVRKLTSLYFNSNALSSSTYSASTTPGPLSPAIPPPSSISTLVG
ncbi:Vacuolar fusion protein CCZ1 B [Podila verticillata]|nr:Vacuolar fusion protein CCZ1 B [Podila verticillata]